VLGPEPAIEGSIMSNELKDSGTSDAPPEDRARFDPKLIEILVCPVTRTTLSYDAARQELISRAARLAFPIRDGLPILVREEARHLDDAKT
jgi:uncharacterized protein